MQNKKHNQEKMIYKTKMSNNNTIKIPHPNIPKRTKIMK